MNLLENKPIIFTAMSKHNFHLKEIISAFVLKQEGVPLNPFMSLGYFLGDMVDRDIIRRANNNMVRIADELWVFGGLADGVVAEINQAMGMGKTIKFFYINGHGTLIKEIVDLGTNCCNLDFESCNELAEFKLNLIDYYYTIK